MNLPDFFTSQIPSRLHITHMLWSNRLGDTVAESTKIAECVEFDAGWSPFYMRWGPHRSTPYGNLGRAKACHNLPIQYQHSLPGGHQTRVKTPDWPQDRTPGDQTMTKKDTRTGTPDWSQTKLGLSDQCVLWLKLSVQLDSFSFSW